MENKKSAAIFQALPAVLAWGGLWGIFEATAGYLLHLLPFSAGWLVWYPAACFFLFNVYRKTRRTWAVLLVGLLSACVKLLNLFLPGRIDRVLNPAVSIVFEALTMAVVIFALRRFFASGERTPPVKALAVLCMNTGWRALYALYLLFLVPDWMREISVISSTEALITFFLVHNLLTGLVLFGAFVNMEYILKPIENIEGELSALLMSLPYRAAAGVRIAGAVCLLGSGIALELFL